MMLFLYLTACSSNTTKLDIDGIDTSDTSSPNMDLDGDGYISMEFGGNDCDDNDPQIHVNAEEICDERDNDCDDVIDEGLLTTYYVDQDNDNFGIEAESTERCEQPNGYVETPGDCDDSNEKIKVQRNSNDLRKKYSVCPPMIF